jgi:hypothetical protein
MFLTFNFRKARWKSTFDIKVKITERTTVNKTLAGFVAQITHPFPGMMSWWFS